MSSELTKQPPPLPATPPVAVPPVIAPHATVEVMPPGEPERKTWLHPLSGGAILLFDNLFFGGELLTFEMGLVPLCLLAFLITTILVFVIQRQLRGDTTSACAKKALFGGVIAGFPTSLSGTVVGGAVLMLSGLNSWKEWLARKRLKRI
ncbi:MAG: hypothetical protein WCO56_14460 [Verrucomicrobiota bacterium]